MPAGIASGVVASSASREVPELRRGRETHRCLQNMTDRTVGPDGWLQRFSPARYWYRVLYTRVSIFMILHILNIRISLKIKKIITNSKLVEVIN